jgi:hypothetical protein
MELWPWLR